MIHVGTFNHDDLENRIDMAKVVAMQKKYPKYKYVQEKKIHKNGNMFLQVSILTEVRSEEHTSELQSQR